MLLLTGTFKEKDYDSQPVNAVELAKAFGLPGLPVEDDVLELVLLKKHIKNVGGKPNYPRSMFWVTQFTGQFPDGSSFQLRYATTRRKDHKTGAEKFTPDHMVWASSTMGFGAKDYEKFVFMALHPNCATSPFSSRTPYVELYDPAKEARQAEANAKVNVEIMSIIWDSNRTPDDVIRLKASGLNVKGKTVNVSPKRATAMIRQDLSIIANTYQKDFLEQWNNVTTLLTGMLIEAKDKGILEYALNANGGRAGWVWKKGERAGSVACYTTNTEEPFKALCAHASADHNYNIFMDILTRSLGDGIASVVARESGVDIQPDAVPSSWNQKPTAEWEVPPILEEKVAADPSELSWGEKVRMAVDQNLIAFHNGEVRWKDESGMFELKPIRVGQKEDTWYNATVNFMLEKESMYHRRVLNQKLGITAAKEA